MIHLEENMMFVRDLFINRSMVLKNGFSFGLNVRRKIVNEKTSLCWKASLEYPSHRAGESVWHNLGTVGKGYR